MAFRIISVEELIYSVDSLQFLKIIIIFRKLSQINTIYLIYFLLIYLEFRGKINSLFLSASPIDPDRASTLKLVELAESILIPFTLRLFETRRAVNIFSYCIVVEPIETKKTDFSLTQEVSQLLDLIRINVIVRDYTERFSQEMKCNHSYSFP